MLTLRELWKENRRRRFAGLPEIDRTGQEIVLKPRVPIQYESRVAETYDPNSPNYRQYQGD